MRFQIKDKKIELVLELMKYRQVEFRKSNFGEFYYFCYGIPCKKCPQTWFCEKHFHRNAPRVTQKQYDYLKNTKPEHFI